MNRPKIVMIGGGSNSWAPNIVKDMLLTDPLQDSEFVLYDIDKKAADLVAAVLRRTQEQLGTKATVTSTDDRAAAFEGAAYFIITISTGGLNSMAQDLAIPEAYGIYHTVGDTSGPGGWARCIRNFDVFVDVAEAINRHAPGAVVLNYTNPMTTLTRVLCDLCTGPVVGLCHGLFENLAFIKDLYRIESEDLISARYAGLNHFFWITELHAKGRDLMANLNRRVRRTGLTALRRQSHPDPMGFKSHHELATELWQLTGTMPYLGDRHTCEFFPGYITSKGNMRKYRLKRTSIEERRDGFKSRKAMLRSWAAKGLPSEFLGRSRETAADIIAAHLTGRAFIDVGNLPNVGQIASLPEGVVVETAALVDANGFSPIAFGPLPEPIQGFVEPYARVFELTVEACFAQDAELALRALRLDPVCSHLNGEQVRELGCRLLRAHRKYAPAMARQV